MVVPQAAGKVVVSTGERMAVVSRVGGKEARLAASTVVAAKVGSRAAAMAVAAMAVVAMAMGVVGKVGGEMEAATAATEGSEGDSRFPCMRTPRRG
jgi:hypothetical protein